MIATFEPDTITKLSGDKVPFQYASREPLGGVEANLWTLYKTALNHGISDLKLEWLDSKTPLHHRVERLL